ncbi:hypothetical protein MASR1M6_36390 [Rubrivivax sp.]
MQAYLLDWANLLLRWAHVITAIAWIGSSFYFVLLDNSLTAPEHEDLKQKGVDGEMWAVHGGGFYHANKYMVAPRWRPLPENLHWSFWESYSTWLTGFGLFTVLYLFNAGSFLVDKSVLRLVAGCCDRGVARLPRRLLDRLRPDLPHARAAQERRPRRRRLRLRVRRLRVVAGLPALRRARGLPAGRRDAGDDDERQRLLLDHPGSAQGGRAASRRAGARPDPRPARQAAQRAQHLLHAAGADRR